MNDKQHRDIEMMEGAKRGGETTRNKYLNSDHFKERKAKISQMRDEGYSLAQIAKELGIAKRNVQRFIKKWLKDE